MNNLKTDIAKAVHDPHVFHETLSDGSKVWGVKIEATYQTGRCVDVVIHCVDMHSAYALSSSLSLNSVAVDVNANMKGGGAVNAPDVMFSNHGTLVQFHLLSQAAKDWVADNVDAPDYMWLGDSIFHCESRYADDIVNGMQSEGLVVS